jgi:hypothetical protein
VILLGKPLLLIFVALVAGATAAGQKQSNSTPPASSYCIPDSIETTVRLLAEEEMKGRWTRVANKDLASWGLERNSDIAHARLAEPFLDITLRDSALDHYLDSNDVDPRPFGSVVWYCFPIVVPGIAEPRGSIVIVRNHDENGKKFSADAGAFMFWGLFYPEGRTTEAVHLRTRYRGEISFVSFLDTGLPSRVMVADSLGLWSIGLADSLIPIAEDSREIKTYLAQRRKH